MSQLFTEFQPVNKKEWLQKVETDLKGKPLADLQWQLGEEIDLAPFYHADDQIESVGTIVDGQDNQWAIGEEFVVRVVKESNRLVLNALEKGVNAPCFVLEHLNTEKELYLLLDGIDLGIIPVHFEQSLPNDQPQDLLQHFYDITTKLGLDNKVLQGSLNSDPILNPINGGMKSLAETIKFAQEFLPNWRVLSVRNPTQSGQPEDIINTLTAHIQQGINYLEVLQQEGLTVDEIAPRMQFSLEIGKSYFVEIAMIRAFKVLWANVLKAYGCTEYPMYFDAYFVDASYGDDQYTNMIRATTQAMSAVVGGVDRLTIRPGNELQGGSTDFTRRIARNVQHILQLESHLERVQDPAAGSYYIEQLTNQLVEKVWAKL